MIVLHKGQRSCWIEISGKRGYMNCLWCYKCQDLPYLQLDPTRPRSQAQMYVCLHAPSQGQVSNKLSVVCLSDRKCTTSIYSLLSFFLNASFRLFILHHRSGKELDLIKRCFIVTVASNYINCGYNNSSSECRLIRREI